MAIYTPRKVPINWYRFDIKFAIELLEAFVKNVENQVKSGIQNFVDKKETFILEEHPEEKSAKIVDVHEGLNSEMWDLNSIFKEHFPNLQRRSAFISLYGFLEHELDKLCTLFKETEHYKIDLKDFNDSGIVRSIKYLNKVANLPIDKDDKRLQTVKSLQKIRNVIVHNDGELTGIDGKIRPNEFAYVQQNEFLSGDKEIILNEGFLFYVLDSFHDLFKYLDELIQKHESLY